jgi:hydroxyacylglutathione hydrolase
MKEESNRVLFKQFRLEAVGACSYLIGCSGDQKALIVDPAADLGVDFYVLEAADLGCAVAGVLETHLHADFISCARELAAACGVPHYLHESARPGYPYTPLADSQRLRLGQVEVRALHTPGHTPEHCCFLVADLARGDEPWFVLTGDSLLPGDVGRPDLLLGDAALDAGTEAERASQQFRSILERILTLPEHVEVYPGHYGGSRCGGAMLSGKPATTIAFERRFNLMIRAADEASFAEMVRRSQRPAPADYRRIKSINLGLVEAPRRAEPGAGFGNPLDPAAVAAALADGALVADLRPSAAFAVGHVPGAVSVPFNRAEAGGLAARMLPRAARLLVVGQPDAVAVAGEVMLRERGLDVVGHLSGGMSAWRAAGGEITMLPTLDVDELRAAGGEFHLIDVREPDEYAEAHIPGAVPWPLAQAASGTPPEDGRPLALICATRRRSTLAASLLLRRGLRVTVVTGGMQGWLQRGYPVATA